MVRPLIPVLATLCLLGCPSPAGPQSAAQAAPAPPPPVAPAPQRPAATQFGFFSENGLRMDVLGVVPVWDEAEAELTLVALPFAPTTEERERVQRDETFMMLLESERSLEGFGDRIPFCHVKLSWPFNPEAAGDLQQASTHVFLNRVLDKGSNMNISRPPGDGAQCTGELSRGGSIKLSSQGETEVSGTTVEWELNFEGKLVPALDDH